MPDSCRLSSRRNVTHQDVKPGNILMCSGPPFNVKLADFGMAQDTAVLKTFCGSQKYAAPEIFDNQHYKNAVDIYSLPGILVKLIYGFPRNKRPKMQIRKENFENGVLAGAGVW
jgi:serine/threonine protein kinase